MISPREPSILRSSRRYFIAGALSIFTLWYINVFFGSALSAIPSYIDGFSLTGDRQQQDGWLSQQEFVDKALENDIYATKYDGSGIRDLCAKAKWRDNIVMSCDTMAGGIGNMKTNVLSCVRYAIESGARLMNPELHLRTAFEVMATSFDWEHGTPLSYMFDEDHFYRTLANDCPQLQFVDKDDKAFDIPRHSLDVNPKKLPGLPEPNWGTNLKDGTLFLPALDDVIQQTIDERNIAPTADQPLRLRFDDISFSWPIATDSPQFNEDFGHVALLPVPIRQISARILYRLYGTLGVQPQSPHVPSVDAFIGAHIRTEADAEGWTSFEDQAQHVRDNLLAKNLSTVFIATGTASESVRLKEFLLATPAPEGGVNPLANVQVLQKWDLMDDETLMMMDALTWDQLALVDLEVMLRASMFVGICESSWGWTIALKRHALSNEDPYDYEAHHLTFVDEYSTLYGPEGGQPVIAPCLWL